ncbi:hypothetical protein [uncultured Acetatifactor sp.]|jgi:hypothetical protein|uniref:hypothetical protein n=1 Tax=uncultured Acetatifactor sp. TaxID=1671927 RepID=UPI0026376640|nr:hypothetical protein [uncultured Acetatifactor sp.]
MDNIYDEFLSMMTQYSELWKEERKRLGLDIAEKASKAEMMTEAIERMQMLDLAPEAINDFQSSGKVSFGMEDGQRFPLDASEQERIHWLDDSNGLLTYAVIRSNSIFGKMISYLVVSPNKCDWGTEHMMMEENVVTAYVYNYDIPIFSEMGSIVIEKLPNGMLKRIYT